MPYHPDEIPNKIMFGGECHEPVCHKPCKKCKGKVSPTMTELEQRIEKITLELKELTRARQDALKDCAEQPVTGDELARLDKFLNDPVKQEGVCVEMANISLIYAEAGTKLVFLGENGHDQELERALNTLEKGKVYTLNYTDLGRSCTYFELEEFPDQMWNSVMFDKAP